MIIEKKFLNKIKDFGLNSYEAKIWTALLSRGISTAGELSEISNVPRSRSYDVLESLEKKGFIIMKIDKPIKYMAVPPEEVIERVKKKTLEEAQKQVDIIESLKTSDVLEELKRIHSKGIDFIEPQDLSAYLKTRNHYYNQMDSMIKNASSSVFLMTTEEGLIRKSQELKRAFSKASKRGVKIKILAPLTKKNESAQEILKQYATLLNINKATMRICMDDNEEIIFALLSEEVDQNYDSALWIKSEFLANSLSSMLNMLWMQKLEKKTLSN